MTDATVLPPFLRPGESFDIGEYQFTREEVIRFAKSWDPQVFHVDEELAKESLLGGLCASGWHTVSVWMKLQRRATAARSAELAAKGKPIPEFGPSPGMKHLRWIKPVYVDDTITYTNTIHDMRKSGSQPDWYIMRSSVSAKNQNDVVVMTFESAVFIKPFG